MINIYDRVFHIDRLVTKPLHGKNPSILPSPEDLKHKVLIRVSGKLFVLEKFPSLFRVKKHRLQEKHH